MGAENPPFILETQPVDDLRNRMTTGIRRNDRIFRCQFVQLCDHLSFEFEPFWHTLPSQPIRQLFAPHTHTYTWAHANSYLNNQPHILQRLTQPV